MEVTYNGIHDYLSKGTIFPIVLLSSIRWQIEFQLWEGCGKDVAMT